MYGTMCLINGTLFVMSMASLGTVIYSFMFRVATGNYARFLATLVVYLFLLVSRLIAGIITKKIAPKNPEKTQETNGKGEFSFWALITAASLGIGFTIVSIASWAKGEVIWWVPVVFVALYAISFCLFMRFCIKNAIDCSDKF